MSAALVRMVFDTSGNLMMIVKPDNDAQLKDPAFSPPGAVVLDVPNATYSGAKDHRSLLALAAPIAATKDATVATAINTKIQAIDSDAAHAAALAANPVPYTTVAADAVKL